MSTRSDPILGPNTAKGDTRLLDPGHLEGPGSMRELPQSEGKPDRDQISATDKISPESYPGKLKNVGLSTEIRFFG